MRERRGGRLEASDAEVFEGQIWTGQGALGLGLIDGLGTLHGVLKARYGDKVRLPQISPARFWWQRRLSIGGRGLESARAGRRRPRGPGRARAMGALRAVAGSVGR